jgi:hypothetical protein
LLVGISIPPECVASLRNGTCVSPNSLGPHHIEVNSNLTHALLLPPVSPTVRHVRFGGLNAVERAAIALHHGGIDHIWVAASCRLAQASVATLNRLDIPASTAGERPFASLPAGVPVWIISGDVVFEPSAVAAILEKLRSTGAPGVAAREASPGTFAVLSAAAIAASRDTPESRVLDVLGALRMTALAPMFCRVMSGAGTAKQIRLAYIAHRYGRDSVLARIGGAVWIAMTALLLHLRPSHASAHPLAR